MDSKKLEMDFGLKCDEVTRLQRSLGEIDELREKYMECEQKLNFYVKKNQTMQEKLSQLQSDLAANGIVTPSSHQLSATAEASYENIIENLKFIIQEHFRNSTTQSELEELKHKVCPFIRYHIYSLSHF